MKSVRILQALLAVLVIAGVIAVLRRNSESEVSLPEKPQAASGTQAAASKPAAGPAEKKSDAPADVYFLAEAGDSATANGRKRPTGNNPPRANGDRRIANPQPLTTKEDGDFIAPRWSPDGLELLVSKPGFSGLYALGAEGGPLQQLTDRENIGFFAEWTEDGKITTRNPNGERITLNPDGSPASSVEMENDLSRVGTFTKDDVVYYRANPGEAAVPVSQGEDRYYGGTVSPDGKYIAYNGLLSGIYIQPLDGSAPPVRVGNGGRPTWMPDSSGVVFAYAEDDGHNLIASDLYLATRDGSSISNLTQNSNAIEDHPVISPNGQYIAYESNGIIYRAELR